MPCYIFELFIKSQVWHTTFLLENIEHLKKRIYHLNFIKHVYKYTIFYLYIYHTIILVTYTFLYKELETWKQLVKKNVLKKIKFTYHFKWAKLLMLK